MRYILSVFLLITACGKTSHNFKGQETNSNLSVPEPQQRFNVKPATPSQCPNGGSVYSIYLDTNENAQFDVEEIALNEQVICNGRDGADGFSMVFEIVPAPVEICASGGSTFLLALDVNHSGIYDPSLPAQQSTTICNGDSAPATAYTPVAPIYVCGQSGPYDEVLLRLENGQVLASLSANANGQNTRLAFLPDGTYQTTDGRNCPFTLVTAQGTRTVSWSNQVQASWPVHY